MPAASRRRSAEEQPASNAPAPALAKHQHRCRFGTVTEETFAVDCNMAEMRLNQDNSWHGWISRRMGIGAMTNARLTGKERDDDKIRSSHPAPWSVEEEAVVRDRNGQALLSVYFKNQHCRRSVDTVFTHDEARHLAAALAKLPELWNNDSRHLAAVLAMLPELWRND